MQRVSLSIVIVLVFGGCCFSDREQDAAYLLPRDRYISKQVSRILSQEDVNPDEIAAFGSRAVRIVEARLITEIAPLKAENLARILSAIGDQSSVEVLLDYFVRRDVKRLLWREYPPYEMSNGAAVDFIPTGEVCKSYLSDLLIFRVPRLGIQECAALFKAYKGEPERVFLLNTLSFTLSTDSGWEDVAGLTGAIENILKHGLSAPAVAVRIAAVSLFEEIPLPDFLGKLIELAVEGPAELTEVVARAFALALPEPNPIIGLSKTDAGLWFKQNGKQWLEDDAPSITFNEKTMKLEGLNLSLTVSG